MPIPVTVKMPPEQLAKHVIVPVHWSACGPSSVQGDHRQTRTPFLIKRRGGAREPAQSELVTVGQRGKAVA
jgi:hypothetical protein